MKFVFAFAIVFLVGAVVADDRVLAEALEKRAEALVEKTKKEVEALKKDHANLSAHLEHQLVLAEGLVASLKAQLADKAKVFESHQVHVIEEDIQYLENSISDEIKNIDGAKTQTPRGENAAQLVTRGKSLVARANDALVLHRATREASAIEHDITAIEALIKAIEAKPTGSELVRDEQQLARHERTLEGLIARAGHRLNPRNPRLPGR